MDQFVVEIAFRKDTTGGAEVAVIVDIAFKFVVDEGFHSKATDIEFTALVECRLLYILLEDKSALTVFISFLDNIPDLFEGRANRDANSSIRILSRLYYPNIFNSFFIFILSFIILL